MQVGKTKDQGLYNKPSAAVHPETLAAGTLPQYNTVVISSLCFDSMQGIKADQTSSARIQTNLVISTDVYALILMNIIIHICLYIGFICVQFLPEDDQVRQRHVGVRKLCIKIC